MGSLGWELEWKKRFLFTPAKGTPWAAADLVPPASGSADVAEHLRDCGGASGGIR